MSVYGCVFVTRSHLILVYHRQNKFINNLSFLLLKKFNIHVMYIFICVCVVEMLLVLIWILSIIYTARTSLLYFTCIEHCINPAHLKFSLYTMYGTNCQNCLYEKEFDTTTFANLHIYNVYVKLIR